MQTIKKFIHYYGPYKTVFFIDLLCAAFISLADLATRRSCVRRQTLFSQKTAP